MININPIILSNGPIIIPLNKLLPIPPINPGILETVPDTLVIKDMQDIPTKSATSPYRNTLKITFLYFSNICCAFKIFKATKITKVCLRKSKGNTMSQVKGNRRINQLGKKKL